jgi:pimeloyl-ACP methyl ester carboxylesterase
MPYAAVNHLKMYYEEHGKPSGPPLVLLHGFSSTGDSWREQIEAFGARYRLIIPDLRGHGRTDNPGGLARMNHRQFARDAVALCGALGLAPAIFCGQSSGAMQLLSLALEAPDLARALVLSGCTHYYSAELRAWWREQTPESWVPPERRPAMAASHTALGPNHWRVVVGAWIALGEHAHADDFPERVELRDIRAPTLIVHGDRDRFFPAEVPLELYRLLPDAELCLLPNTGHGPPRERPDWFNSIVLDFLTRRAG